MLIHLYIAPAAAGKSEYVLHLARQTARALQAEVHVCVSTRLQVHAWRQRLAQAGGAIGVRVFTINGLAAACLNAAGEAYTELSEPVQYRLLQALLTRLPLQHYAPLVGKPGFTQALQAIISELKAAQIDPLLLQQGVEVRLNEPRLRELAQIYMAYQTQLQTRRWADRAGLTWLAAEALAQRAPQVACDWPLLIIDGFDDFAPAQLALLRILAQRVGKMVITLNDEADDRTPSRTNRYRKTRRLLEAALHVTAAPLPNLARPGDAPPPVLRHLTTNLFSADKAERVTGEPAVRLVAAPNQAAEARAALRWLKTRLVEDRLSPDEVALLARDITPYRPFIVQAAAEFGLPIRLVDGAPLGSSPAIAALMDLLRLGLPDPDSGAPSLPRRLVVEAWRSPYFDWSARPALDAPPINIRPGDAERLDSAARHGRVTGGLDQWQTALQAWAAQEEASAQDVSLPATFDRFWRRIQPLQAGPPQTGTMRDFVGWVESLIGSDPASQSGQVPAPPDPASLNMVARIRAGETAARDLAALQALKDVLRGLVWAEDAITPRPNRVSFPRFFAELTGAIESSAYHLPAVANQPDILVANSVQARGLPFKAVALLGLAEGVFPATIREDPFLRDADRQVLREELGLPLDPSTQSAEQAFFYEAISRPSRALLLTRPRLAESGAEWLASPFWDEVCRLVEAEPMLLSSEQPVPPRQAASWPELLESVVAYPSESAVREWAQRTAPERCASVEAAGRLLADRQRRTRDPYNGELSDLADEFGRRFGPEYGWSPSRLEQYRTCGHFFFVSTALGLEPRPEPVEGVDSRQLGSVYHDIFEAVYRYPEQLPAPENDEIHAYITDVATPILGAAPEKYGFRETAWWAQTRDEIIHNVTRSVIKLAELSEGFTPVRTEAGFWGKTALQIRDGDDRFRLHGFIDRVDRDEHGRIRIIDYKLGGSYGFTRKAVEEGKKLQLPLYARAAQDALGLGQALDGFYWHFAQAVPSKFRLADFEGGVEAAIKAAITHAWTAIRGARAGWFVPDPPRKGCPDYCPAAAFCWQYRPGHSG